MKLFELLENELPEYIDYNGQQKPTRNSLGNYIGTTIEAIEAFYNWFGNSKVVDEKGRPLVVYHGTEIADIDEFFGGWWSEHSTVTKEFGSIMYKAYLRIINALEINEFDNIVYDEYNKFYGEDYTREDFDERDILIADEAASGSEFTEYLKKKYDGIITYDETNLHPGMAYVVFNSNQIKSINNKGTFDPNSNNIYECVMNNKDIFKEFINENKNNKSELLLERIVKSSWILRLDYVDAENSDEDMEYVELQTKKGAVYRLYGVPQKLFKSWLRAPSKGKFWWNRIAGVYIAERY